MAILGPATPVLRSRDEASTRAFYVDYLGFEVVFTHRFAPHLPLYLGLQHGACTLHLSEHRGDAVPGGAARIPVADVRAYCAALLAKGAKYPRPSVVEQPWATDMDVVDPAGNRLIFFTDPEPE
jgi:catechol 2,3-dioxygenase-like lactoylglutathione lyase family enzyme